MKTNTNNKGVSLYTFTGSDYTPTWASSFGNRREATKWMQQAAKGVGALNTFAVDILKIAPDCLIYYSHRNHQYIIYYIAHHDGQTLYGNVEDYKNLLMYYRKCHQLKGIVNRIEEATEIGCNYVIRTEDRRASVEVRKEPENGLYIATWFVGGEIDETRTALTAKGVAEMVLNFQQGYAWEPNGVKEETPHYRESEKLQFSTI